jgi:hypothetical protein
MMDCRDKLDAAIRAGHEIIASDSTAQVSMNELIALARKVTPSTRAPPGSLFSVDQGPAEGLPIRFRLPYPTLDEMRMSLVASEGNKLTDHGAVSTISAVGVTKAMSIHDDSDDFEDDF